MIYNRILFTPKKNENAICNNMDGPTEYHTNWSQKQKDKYNIPYMWNPKYDSNEPIYKTDSQTQRTDLWLPRGIGDGEGWIRSLGSADANYYIENR